MQTNILTTTRFNFCFYSEFYIAFTEPVKPRYLRCLPFVTLTFFLFPQIPKLRVASSILVTRSSNIKVAKVLSETAKPFLLQKYYFIYNRKNTRFLRNGYSKEWYGKP